MCSTVIFPTAPSLLVKIQCKYFRLCSRVSWRAVFNRLKASLQASKKKCTFVAKILRAQKTERALEEGERGNVRFFLDVINCNGSRLAKHHFVPVLSVTAFSRPRSILSLKNK